MVWEQRDGDDVCMTSGLSALLMNALMEFGLPYVSLFCGMASRCPFLLPGQAHNFSVMSNPIPTNLRHPFMGVSLSSD